MALKIYSVEVVYINFMGVEETVNMLVVAASQFDAVKAIAKKFNDIVSIIVFEDIGEV